MQEEATPCCIELEEEMPKRHHTTADVYGLRSIAILELLKGAGAVAAGILLLRHPDPSFGRIAQHVLGFLHIKRNSDFAIEAISWARRIEIRHLHWTLAFIAIYALLRIAEAWGLWRVRQWAEWFGFLNGILYLPIEVFELAHGFSWIKIAVLGINILVVGYLGWEIRKARRFKGLEAPLPTPGESPATVRT
jgi:uncharacterized membrane protein (DUF2068 family)